MKNSRKKAKRMDGIITFLVGWFLVSIPSSLAIGAFLGRRTRPLVMQSPTYASRYAAMMETSEMPAL
jgi:hypothetical protein